MRQARFGTGYKMSMATTKRNKIEQELEDWLFEDASRLEDGMRWVSRQRAVKWRGQLVGKMDLFGVDKDGKICIVELKAGTLTSLAIGQGIGYYHCLLKQQPAPDYRVIFIGNKLSTIFRVTSEWFTETTGVNIETLIYEKWLGQYALTTFDPVLHSSYLIPRED